MAAPEYPEVDALTEREKASQLAAKAQEARADLLSRFPAADVGHPTLVETVSLDEWATVQVKCLADLGIESAVYQGGLSTVGTESHEQAQDIAKYICGVQYPVDPLYEQPLNQSQLEYLYTYYVGDATACLKSLGFRVDTPPSRREFAEKYDSAASWSPFTSAAESATDFWEIETECPEVPSGIYGKPAQELPAARY